MHLDDWWNVVHFEVWERRGAKLVRALARRWQRWHGRLQERLREGPYRVPQWGYGLEAWRQAHEAARARRRSVMDDVVTAGIQQALARTVLDKSSKELRDALLLEVWERHRDELQAQAFDAIKAEHRQELEDLRERLRDGVAQERRQLERDADAMIEQGIRDGMAEREQELMDRLAERKQQRDEARQERDRAERVLVDLITELVPMDHRVYLYSGGAGIRRLPLHTLNTVLARHGLAVKAKSSPSERQVACELGPQAWGQRSLFRLAPMRPVGGLVGGPVVVPEPEDDDEAPPAEAPPGLPPAAPEAPP